MLLKVMRAIGGLLYVQAATVVLVVLVVDNYNNNCTSTIETENPSFQSLKFFKNCHFGTVPYHIPVYSRLRLTGLLRAESF